MSTVDRTPGGRLVGCNPGMLEAIGGEEHTPSAVLGPEDLEGHAPAPFYHAVRTIATAGAPFVTFVNHGIALLVQHP